MLPDGSVSAAGVVIGGLDGILYKLALDGSLVWSFTTRGQIRGAAVATRDGRIVFGSTDMKLYCINARSGQEVWSFYAGQEVTSSPVVQDVSISFGTRRDSRNPARLIALKRDGTLRWQVNVTASVEGELIEDPKTAVVYAASNDGKIFAVTPDGRQLWRYITGGAGGICGDHSKTQDEEASPSQNTECSFSELGAHGATSPCLVDGVLVTTSQNKMIYGLSLDGRLAWKHPTSKRIRSPPRCFSSTDAFGQVTSTVLSASNDRHLYSLSV